MRYESKTPTRVENFWRSCTFVVPPVSLWLTLHDKIVQASAPHGVIDD